MAKITSTYLDVRIMADGVELRGGTVERLLKWLGSDIIITGSGSEIYTFPAATDTLVGRISSDVMTNKTLTSPVINTALTGTAILDEDNFASDSATKVATQQSIKAYIASQIGAIVESDPVFIAWDKSTGITITESQITDLQAYLTVEVDPVFSAWDKSTGISITESQISDLKAYLTAETDPVFSAWDKSTGISITESQISDLQAYLTVETDPVFGASEAASFIAGDKSKLDGIEAGAEVNDVDSVNAQIGAVVLDLDDIGDGATYERVKGDQLSSGIYIDATDAVKGIVELAINTETLAGTDTGRVITPSNLEYARSVSGWTPITGTFTYASATTINVSSGAASIYSVSDKIRFQNNDSGTYLYAHIVTVADTLLTVLGDAVPNATLTDAYYSKIENPQGFPHWFTSHIPIISGGISAGSGTYATQYNAYSIKGRTCEINGYITITNHTGTGDIRIYCLPIKNQGITNINVLTSSLTLPANGYYLAGWSTAGLDYLVLKYMRNNTTGVNIQLGADVVFSVYWNGHYQF